jgi:hypothetical protein
MYMNYTNETVYERQTQSFSSTQNLMAYSRSLVFLIWKNLFGEHNTEAETDTI